MGQIQSWTDQVQLHVKSVEVEPMCIKAEFGPPSWYMGQESGKEWISWNKSCFCRFR